MFGIEAGDRCFTSPDAGATYQKHGESTDCEEGGKGGDWAMNVYRVTSSSIGKNRVDESEILYPNCIHFVSMGQNWDKIGTVLFWAE